METFPSISCSNTTAVDPQQFAAKGTTLWYMLAGIVALIVSVFLVISVWGIVLIIFSAISSFLLRRKAAALIHGSGIKVSDRQFPAIYKCANDFKKRMNLSRDVDIYIVEDNISNAFAVRIGKKNIVLLTDDIIHACEVSGRVDSLGFILAHEMAHIALNHNGIFKSWAAQIIKIISRLNEYSADAVATALVGDRTTAFYGLLTLTTGGEMVKFVDPDEVVKQAQEVGNSRQTKKAERGLTHPLLLNRIHRIVTTNQI